MFGSVRWLVSTLCIAGVLYVYVHMYVFECRWRKADWYYFCSMYVEMFIFWKHTIHFIQQKEFFLYVLRNHTI